MKHTKNRSHRAFQCLETFYLAPDIASRVKIGDRVDWNFERGVLTVRDMAIWEIPLNRDRYYGGIDFHRHKLISWIVAKEEQKVKIFTSVELKHPYGAIPSTENQDIAGNWDIILPRLTGMIGKGFWKIFEHNEHITSKTLISLLDRVREIKSIADEVHTLETLSEREQKFVEIIDRIQQVNTEEIPQIRQEIAESHHEYDLDHIENSWKKRLSGEVWSNLDAKVQKYLKTGELVYGFLDGAPIENLDWTCANVEFCKAIEIELNCRIVAEFGRWLRRNLTTLDIVLDNANAVPENDFWLKFLKNAQRTSNVTAITIPIGSIQWAFRELYKTNRRRRNSFHNGLFRLLEKFSDELEANRKEILNDLPQALSELVRTRNGSLHTEFLRRKKVDSFVAKLQELFPKLIMFSA